MKQKTFVVLLALVFLPVLSVQAFERGGGGDGADRGGGGGGWQGRSGGDNQVSQGNSGVEKNQGNSSAVKSQGNVRSNGKTNPSNRNKSNHAYNPQGRAQGGTSSHHFKSQGTVGNGNHSITHNNSSYQATQPQNQTTHHFGGSNTNARVGSQGTGGGKTFAHPSALSPQAKNLGINRAPQAFTNRHQLMPEDHGHLSVPRPAAGPQGSALHASVISRTAMNGAVVRSQMSVVGRAQVTAQINVYNRTEVVPNHYYWHNYNGWNYCHYYDPYGYHWYGWYVGGNCFWSRYWSGNWWWYDPVYYHWCYWHDGWWWWQDPANVQVVYVYDNGNYVNAATVGETSTSSSPSAPSDSTLQPAEAKPLAPVSVDKVLNSKDGTRQVKIVGGDAFLYDTVVVDNDNKPVFLSDNVKDVKFIPGTAGAPPQILVSLTDGTTQTYDSDGNAVQGQAQN